MVLKEGQEDGVGIWEINDYKNIENIVKSLVKEKIREQEKIKSKNLDYEETLVVGSYGAGLGVPGKSDLDLIVLVYYKGDNRSFEFSNIMKEIAGKINGNKNNILSKYQEFTDLECYVYPYLERQQHLAEMANHEPVEYYYNITKDTKESYYI